MKYDDLPYDMSLEEIHEPHSEFPLPNWDKYQEEVITCTRCGRTGPRYEIEGHSCADEAA